MTHHIIKPLAVLAMGAVLLAGCGKDNKDNGKPEATQIKQTECGQHFETQAKASPRASSTSWSGSTAPQG